MTVLNNGKKVKAVVKDGQVTVKLPKGLALLPNRHSVQNTDKFLRGAELHPGFRRPVFQFPVRRYEEIAPDTFRMITLQLIFKI